MKVVVLWELWFYLYDLYLLCDKCSILGSLLLWLHCPKNDPVLTGNESMYSLPQFAPIRNLKQKCSEIGGEEREGKVL